MSGSDCLIWQGWDLAAEEGQGPEIFGDVNGEPSVLTVLYVLTIFYIHS